MGEPSGPVRRSDYISIADSCFRLSDFCFLTFSRTSDSSGLESRCYLGLATAAMKRISVLLSKGSHYRDWECDNAMHWLQQCSWCQFPPARLLVLTPAEMVWAENTHFPTTSLCSGSLQWLILIMQSWKNSELEQLRLWTWYGEQEQEAKGKGRTICYYTLGNKICLKKSRKSTGPFCIFSHFSWKEFFFPDGS